MPYEIITVSFTPGSRTFNADDLNKFCANKKILYRKVEFFNDNEYNYWTVFLEYDPGMQSLVSHLKYWNSKALYAWH